MKPTLSFEHIKRAHIPAVLRIEEENHAYEGWGEADFMAHMRAKEGIGAVCVISEVPVAFCMYNVKETCIEIVKLEVSPSMVDTKAAQVLIDDLKKKCVRSKKLLEATFWEGEPVAKLQMFAKNGFKSALKKNFFLAEHQFTPDGVHFSWDASKVEAENEILKAEKQKNSDF